MEMPAPAVIPLIHAPYKFHPAAHTLILIFQYRRIAGKLITHPRNHTSRIPPCRRGTPVGAEPRAKGRHNIWHLARVPLLFLRHIVEIFRIESIAIPEITCRRRKYLRITRPAHPLIALRTVRRHIQKIPLLPPFHIGNQPVDQIIPRCEHTKFRNIGIQNKCGKILHFNPRQSFHLYIAVAIKGKFRRKHNRFSRGFINIFRLRAPEIVPVKISIL